LAAEQYIQLPPNSTGLKARTIEKTVSANVVEAEVQVLDRDGKRTVTGKYLTAIPVVTGSTSSGYVFGSIQNPPGSGILMAIKRFKPVAFAAGAATFVPLVSYRVTGATGGTVVNSGLIAKKDRTDATSQAQVRYAGVAITGADQPILFQITPGHTGFPFMPDIGIQDYREDEEDIILRESDGLAVRQLAPGTTGHRVSVMIEWEEFTGPPRLSQTA